MKAALLQMTSSDDPEANLAGMLGQMREAAANGAEFILTPEVCNCVSSSRSHQNAVLRLEHEDATLAALQDGARDLGVWLLIGSLALKTQDPDGRFANRSFMINPDGDIVARYDKIHMFDVQVTPEETYRESDGYRPGDKAVLAETPFGVVGMTICYDVRFPYLHRELAKAGATILTVPAAFSHVTGAAHWETLLRARAIETGCYVLAPAQTGTHPAKRGQGRRTYGHSLVISPWGEILSDAGEETGISYVDLDPNAVAQARRKVPSLTHDREFDSP
ncbi:carbon-nitrogen hydrolase family protein [Shimia thalassica]|uniref:carbon-nitrogen hydrolase family protein n=1 Tax=Shimia thalassica TaxID=1715693 RepID=UPI0026E15539|nr:carbon-nitrogen hydrolase family protein [Shimia thalassica]MDO6484893.1 carbon-nitrogen hydrolase family protein [Shimia thalassica]MDO6799807.1 carbon-nitrogen hydrolase family protein [Shimia thalassica]